MRRLLSALYALAVALVLALPASPALAASGDYSIDELSTEMTVLSDSALHVVERQTLTFEDENLGIVWYLHEPEGHESVRIVGVRVAPVDNGSALLDGWTPLQMVDSNTRTQGREPGDTADAALRRSDTKPWYSYRIGDGCIRCYFPVGEAASASTADETRSGEPAQADGDEPQRTYVVETEYTLTNHVKVFRDIGELEWRYVDESLPAGPGSASLQVRLPLPAETDPAQASGEVMAWGHGPSDGTFAIGEDGTVTYRIARMQPGEYADAHVVFPASWLYNLPANAPNHSTSARLPDVMAEESEWVDIWQREAEWDNKVRVLFLAIAVVELAAGAIGVLRRGRGPLARRALVRTAATLGITALGAQLFFREPLTTVMLALLAAAVAIATLTVPLTEDEPDEAESQEADAADEAAAPEGATVNETHQEGA